MKIFLAILLAFFLAGLFVSAYCWLIFLFTEDWFDEEGKCK